MKKLSAFSYLSRSTSVAGPKQSGVKSKNEASAKQKSMQKKPEENIEAVKKMSLQFLAEAIGQCPAGLEKSRNRDIVFAVVGFQYGAVQSAAYVTGLDEACTAVITQEVIERINGMDRETAARLLALMPMLAEKEYPPIGVGSKAIISFYNSIDDEQKLAAACSLQEILKQIDEA